ncbi:MAG: hypothetical protein AB7I42_24310 [Bradyrhizobium sp.]|uniref:hypothetical protein n=1 Tax=Bradyrhizobium sp. TaxID=376 RepID=UPI003D0B1E60
MTGFEKAEAKRLRTVYGALAVGAAITIAIVFLGCIAAARTGDGDRTVEVPPIPFVGPPAPIEIDQDSLAGQIAAKVTAKIEATVQGFGTYNSQFGVGVVVVMVAIILVLATALILTLWLSHRREMKRIECSIAHPKEV